MSNKSGMGNLPWYKEAIIYEVHVRGFYDSNGDGVGDFQGLTQKLPYLAELGVTALWLLPFYPSPLKDEGYDVADYKDVHPSYGSLDDFKEFLKTAHGLGLRVITELVLNHTSVRHQWFQRSRTAKPGTKWREFYVWSDTPDRYRGVRVIFSDFEKSNWAWDPVANAYYWHRFFSHQPDLNLDSQDVQEALLDVVDFWFGLGVDGMRLDAVPYLFEREGTPCENLPETHEFLKKLRLHVDDKFKDKMLLAEADQLPPEEVAYFGSGNECNMAFQFPLTLSLFEALELEDGSVIRSVYEETPPIPKTCQWATFLRNHDQLSLEMVPEEQRDRMYLAYAKDENCRLNRGIRRRLAPLLGNDRSKIELMNFLLFTLPGTPVLYYGDEIGMGDNCRLPDRGGVRTPMQWSSGLNAGFSVANPSRLYLPVISDPPYDCRTVNALSQRHDESSLFEWTRRLIGTASRLPVLRTGRFQFLEQPNTRVLSFIRYSRSELVVAMASLSHRPEEVRVALDNHKGAIRTEISRGITLEALGRRSLGLSLGPHAYALYSMARKPGPSSRPHGTSIPTRRRHPPQARQQEEERS